MYSWFIKYGFKDQTLGIGAYGKVCRARCDNLDCAAKLLHETLFDRNAEQLVSLHKQHRLPVRRFEKECEFLNMINHPHIIQYLGTYHDSSSGLAVLLMELMDCSLTNYLETSQYLYSLVESLSTSKSTFAMMSLLLSHFFTPME